MRYGQMENREAEQAVIGAFLSDERTHKHIKRLVPEDFTDPDYRQAFVLMCELLGEDKKIDLVTMNDRMEGDLLSKLLDAVRMVPTTIFIDNHVELIKEYSIRRVVSTVCIDLYKSMGDSSEAVSAAIMDARRRLSDIGSASDHDWDGLGDIMKSAITDVTDRESGEKQALQSGVSFLDNIIGGFFPGELTIIGARPGEGKSALGMVIALELAKRDKNVAMCSLEMMPEQYGMRMLSYLSGVDGMKMRMAKLEQEDWDRISDAAAAIARMKGRYIFRVRNIEDLEESVQKLVDQEPVDMLIVDYIQLMGTKKRMESERLKVGHMSWSLKQMAMAYKIPVIALAQLRRPETIDRMPTMKDLRESGNLESDADGIILLHQPRSADSPTVYARDRAAFDVWAKQGLKYTVIAIEKQRMGNTGRISMLFDGAHMRYLEIARDK